MWLNLASITFIVIIVPFLLWNLVKKPYDYYKSIIISSLCFSSLILFGNYPIADEIVFTVIAGFLFLKFLKNRKEFYSIKFNHETLFKLVLITYFALNTLVSILFEYNPSKLRFLNIFLSLFVLVAAMKVWNSENIKINGVVKKALHVNLLIWIAYYFILRILGIDWNYQQAITYVGSTYAAFVPGLGLVMLLLLEQKKIGKNLSLGYLLFYAGSVVASQIYYSRVLEFTIVVATLLALVIKRNAITGITLILVFLGSHFISGPVISSNYGHISTLQINNPSVVDIAKETKSSVNFIAKPRSSDADRSQQIRCSTRLIISNDKFHVKLFGYGQNNHKTALQACTEEKFGPLTEGKIIRPVGYAALITDFGLVGIGLILGLFVIIFAKLRNEKGFLLYSVMLFQIASWTLVTNYLDHEAIYIILLLNLFGLIARELSEENKPIGSLE